MIAADALAWMKPPEPADTAAQAAEGAAQEEDNDPWSFENLTYAARDAVAQVNQMKHARALVSSDGTYTSAQAELSPGPENVTWSKEEMQLAQHWSPAGPGERKGLPPHSLEAFKEVYAIGPKLGSGSFASVFMATRKRSGRKVAVKHLKTSREADVSEADIREEADIMSKLDHPHVIHTHDAFWGFRGSDGGGGGSGTSSSSSSSSSSGSSRKGIWIVEELCEGGPIFRWLKERSSDVRASEALHRRLTAELLAGLSYLHTHGILHRDIKPQNLLMATKADSSPLRIADFGLCRRLQDGGQRAALTAARASTAAVGLRRHQAAAQRDDGEDDSAEAGADKTPQEMRRFRERRVTKGFVGTPAWMAPEVLVCAAPDAQGYSFAADIWSAGCVVYAVLTGRLDARSGPWPADEEPGEAYGDGHETTALFRAILERRLDLEAVTSGEARALVQSMLVLAPKDRVTAADALAHPWLAVGGESSRARHEVHAQGAMPRSAVSSRHINEPSNTAPSAAPSAAAAPLRGRRAKPPVPQPHDADGAGRRAGAVPPHPHHHSSSSSHHHHHHAGHHHQQNHVGHHQHQHHKRGDGKHETSAATGGDDRNDWKLSWHSVTSGDAFDTPGWVRDAGDGILPPLSARGRLSPLSEVHSRTSSRVPSRSPSRAGLAVGSSGIEMQRQKTPSPHHVSPTTTRPPHALTSRLPSVPPSPFKITVALQGLTSGRQASHNASPQTSRPGNEQGRRTVEWSDSPRASPRASPEPPIEFSGLDAPPASARRPTARWLTPVGEAAGGEASKPFSTFRDAFRDAVTPRQSTRSSNRLRTTDY